MGTSFFELFLVDLDENMTSTGYRRQQNQKQSETMIIYSNYSLHGEHHVQGEKAFFGIISAFKASNTSQITFVTLMNVLTSISERFGHNFQF